jgi:hypothetical protein
MRIFLWMLLFAHFRQSTSFWRANSDLKHIFQLKTYNFLTRTDAMNRKGDKSKSKQSNDQSVSKANVAKQYQYVQGGFSEVRPPTSSDNNSTIMYAAFDSALRASSYNMFCSPLLPVEPPTPFKKKLNDNKFEGEPTTVREYQKRASEEASMILKQYQELDRYLSSSSPTKKVQGVKEQESPSIPRQNEMREWLEAAQSPNSIAEENYDQLQALLGFERMGATSRMNSATFKGNMSKHRAV